MLSSCNVFIGRGRYIDCSNEGHNQAQLDANTWGKNNINKLLVNCMLNFTRKTVVT